VPRIKNNNITLRYGRKSFFWSSLKRTGMDHPCNLLTLVVGKVVAVVVPSACKKGALHVEFSRKINMFFKGQGNLLQKGDRQP
jgi:hypothetical protein